MPRVETQPAQPDRERCHERSQERDDLTEPGEHAQQLRVGDPGRREHRARGDAHGDADQHLPADVALQGAMDRRPCGQQAFARASGQEPQHALAHAFSVGQEIEGEHREHGESEDLVHARKHAADPMEEKAGDLGENRADIRLQLFRELTESDAARERGPHAQVGDLRLDQLGQALEEAAELSDQQRGGDHGQPADERRAHADHQERAHGARQASAAGEGQLLELAHDRVEHVGEQQREGHERGDAPQRP